MPAVLAVPSRVTLSTVAWFLRFPYSARAVMTPPLVAMSTELLGPEDPPRGRGTHANSNSINWKGIRSPELWGRAGFGGPGWTQGQLLWPQQEACQDVVGRFPLLAPGTSGPSPTPVPGTTHPDPGDAPRAAWLPPVTRGGPGEEPWPPEKGLSALLSDKVVSETRALKPRVGKSLEPDVGGTRRGRSLSGGRRLRMAARPYIFV